MKNLNPGQLKTFQRGDDDGLEGRAISGVQA